MALRHMLFRRCMQVRREAAQMRCDTLAALEDLDSVRSEASLHLLACKLIRNAVEVSVDLNVIIDGGANRLPVRGDVRLRRQWLEHRLIYGCKQRSPRAFTFPERAIVEPFKQNPQVGIV